MDSRMDKYTSNNSTSRSSRNKKLYEDLYSDTSYNNSVVLDDSKEVDIAKIKEIIDRQNNPEKKRIVRPTKDIYDDIDILKEEVNEKVYDINEVLKEAKSKRDILEEANEKNTLTNIPTSNGTNNYKDLTSEANKLKTGTVEVKEITREMEKISAKEDEKEPGDTTEYSTNTFMFDKRDFVTEDSYNEQMEGTNKFVKFIIFLITVAIILGAYYVIRTYILK